MFFLGRHLASWWLADRRSNEVSATNKGSMSRIFFIRSASVLLSSFLCFYVAFLKLAGAID